jgi:hypothetical protein
MAVAFRPEVVKQAFVDNGQICASNGILPSLENLAGTYRGSINEGHILHNTLYIVKKYYEEQFINGKISEKTYDNNNIENDRDSNGNLISRDFEINKENCQRAKSLSSLVQRQERLDLIHRLKTEQYDKDVILYNTETDKYKINTEYEYRIAVTYHKIQMQNHQRSTNNQSSSSSPSFLAFSHITSGLTTQHLGRHMYKGELSKSKLTITQLKTFIQLRHKLTKFTGKKPVYMRLQNLSKDTLIDRALECIATPLNQRHFSLPTPVGPKDTVEE